MKYLSAIIGWIFSLVFTLLLISMLLMQKWAAAAVLVILVLLVLPPVQKFIRNIVSSKYFKLIKTIVILILLFVFSRLLIDPNPVSIYKSPEVKVQFIEIYDRKMQDWPVPYQDIFITTQYGRVHVIASGSTANPPMLLLHASGVSSWSWKYNVQPLSKHYRIYAIDLIGDAGKSEFASLDHVMKTGKDQADLYAEIMDSLQMDSAFVVGASEGGFIASNLARFYPDRVRKLVLLGPMGYSGAMGAVMRITFAQFFPIKPIQESTFNWAFSDDAALKKEFNDWFPLLMSNVFPVKVAPLPLSAEERQTIRQPVLFVFGERDNLVGDPIKATVLVQDMPDVHVKTIDAGHLMGGEKPELVNGWIIEFMNPNAESN